MASDIIIQPSRHRIPVCPYGPGHANLIGWFEERPVSLILRANRLFKLIYVPVGCFVVLSSNTSVMLHCHSFLILFNREAKTASDVDFLVGFETEFMLLKSTNPIEPINGVLPIHCLLGQSRQQWWLIWCLS